MKHDSVENKGKFLIQGKSSVLNCVLRSVAFTSFPVPPTHQSGSSSHLGNLSYGELHLLKGQHTSALPRCGSLDSQSLLPPSQDWRTFASTVFSAAGCFCLGPQTGTSCHSHWVSCCLLLLGARFVAKAVVVSTFAKRFCFQLPISITLFSPRHKKKAQIIPDLSQMGRKLILTSLLIASMSLFLAHQKSQMEK